MPCNGPLNVAHKIFFGPGRAHRRGEDLAGGHRKIGDQGLRPMSNVLKFHALDQTWLHWPGRMRPFMSLDTGLLIGAHDMHPGACSAWAS